MPELLEQTPDNFLVFESGVIGTERDFHIETIDDELMRGSAPFSKCRGGRRQRN